ADAHRPLEQPLQMPGAQAAVLAQFGQRDDSRLVASVGTVGAVDTRLDVPARALHGGDARIGPGDPWRRFSGPVGRGCLEHRGRPLLPAVLPLPDIGPGLGWFYPMLAQDDG